MSTMVFSKSLFTVSKIQSCCSGKWFLHHCHFFETFIYNPFFTYREGKQRQMAVEMDKVRYSNVSFVNFYREFSQSVSVNQAMCPIAPLEIPWNSPGLLCYISAVGHLSSLSALPVCVCARFSVSSLPCARAAEALWSLISGQCNCTFGHFQKLLKQSADTPTLSLNHKSNSLFKFIFVEKIDFY